MKRIALTRGKTAVVDDADYRFVSGFKWRAMPANNGRSWEGATWYAGTGRNTRMMHRIIMKAPKGVQVDHRNRDGLDNRRRNLRLATRGQQRANSGRSKPPGGSRFKGVSWWKGHGHDAMWRARLQKDGKVYIRYSTNEEEAAEMYNKMAAAHFGSYAKLNVVKETRR